MSYIFLDESGQFNKHNDEKYFIVGSFTVGDQRRTEKQFRVWQHEKFPRKLRDQSEIKFSEVKIPDTLRLKTLKFISNLDVRINFSYLLRQNIPDDFIKKDKLQSGLLYTHIIEKTLEMYLPINDMEIRIFCDRRHLKGIKHSKFKDILISGLLPQLPKDAIVQIEMVDSTSNANIQIADWISGALAHYFEKKNLGDKCFQIFKNNILGSKELFKDYWDVKYAKQKPQSSD